MNPPTSRLTAILSKAWWALLLRGLVAIVFGALTLFQPGISLAALLFVFGVYALADGLLGVWTAISGRSDHDDWWVLFLGGLIGVVVGILTFVVPGITALGLLFYIAIWAIVTGVLQILAAVRLRKEIQGEWLLILAGLASVVFGVVLMSRPEAGALAVLWLVGMYAIILGVILVFLAFRVRNFSRKVAGS
jgi:uncharacterized membrane protein HdeD (DUF308 family)